MRTVLVVPSLDASLDALGRALYLVQRHRVRPRPLEFLDRVDDVSRAVERVGGPSSAAAVPAQPSLEAGETAEPEWLRSVADVRAQHPKLSIAVVVVGPTAPAIPGLAKSGVTRFVVWEEDGTAAALAVRIATVAWSSFIRPFVAALPEDMPERFRLTLACSLGELEEGAAPDVARLARACDGKPKALRAAVESYGLGSLDEWLERARVYAALHRAATVGNLASEAPAMGFAGQKELEEACRRCVGEGARELVLRRAWRDVPEMIVERALATRERSRRAPPDAPTPSGSPSAQVPDEGGFTCADLDAALGVARSLVGSDKDAEDVRQQALVKVERRRRKLAERGAGGKPVRLTRSYLMSAVRTAARDLQRRRKRTRATVSLEDIGDGDVPSSDPFLGVLLGDPILRREVKRALQDLPPAQAVAVMLRHGYEWKDPDVSVLLDRSPDSVRALVRRATAALASSLDALWTQRKNS